MQAELQAPPAQSPSHSRPAPGSSRRATLWPPSPGRRESELGSSVHASPAQAAPPMSLKGSENKQVDVILVTLFI